MAVETGSKSGSLLYYFVTENIISKGYWRVCVGGGIPGSLRLHLKLEHSPGAGPGGSSPLC